MNLIDTKFINYIAILLFFVVSATPSMAQDNKNNKEAKVKPISRKVNSKEAIVAQLSGMTREDKNSLSTCPLHNKSMKLSDNYRADGSKFEPGDNYPFAYQLNYRRYCPVCTRVMSKEGADVVQEEAAEKTKGGVLKCKVHKKKLQSNPAYNPDDYETNPNKTEMPHARQYRFARYCKICSKVYKIQEKAAD